VLLLLLLLLLLLVVLPGLQLFQLGIATRLAVVGIRTIHEV